MKIIIYLACLICLSMDSVSAQSAGEKNKSGLSVLRHVVMFKFQDKASAADIKKVVDAFGSLKGKIAEIKDFEWGVNNSPEKLNQGLTHCFILSFQSTADRDAYLVHPAHKAFGTLLSPYFEKATVLDYWANQ